MISLFSHIGLIGKHTNPEAQTTFSCLVSFLQSHNIHVYVEPECAHFLQLSAKTLKREEFGHYCDLIIVVGGDGSLIHVAHSLIDADIPIIGVNRGHRGFLTDLSPQALMQSLEPILQGAFQKERRFLLHARVMRQNDLLYEGRALNEVVVCAGHPVKIIEFELRINERYVYRQRSDGLITATPTGSTAYALSGGGPILHPHLDALVLVPMHPCMLSSRPIVIEGHATLAIDLLADASANACLSCDGQAHFNLQMGDKIVISRAAQTLCLLHPEDYDYYDTLRSKLGWNT